MVLKCSVLRWTQRHYRVSVPLRGYGFEISTHVILLSSNSVSVPLRGYGFEMIMWIIGTLLVIRKFPSPCGDMVLKSSTITTLIGQKLKFPSPCGDMVLKGHTLSLLLAESLVSVPLQGSPILASPVATGEVASNASRWGRLCLAYTSDAMKVYSLRSWRPFHRLRGPPPPLWQGRLEVRSVPLRGYGFEIMAIT